MCQKSSEAERKLRGEHFSWLEPGALQCEKAAVLYSADKFGSSHGIDIVLHRNRCLEGMEM